ncbi:hypothetical protein BMS3Bbin15_00950 [archaeon BMS3Bbin15]|nr:hypothetical protein BMS3Bbin15_00950 [archaeon BMS3Bbin15]
MDQIYSIIGKITITVLVLLALFLIISLILGVMLVKKNRLLFPRILLFTVDTFYLQFKKIANFFGISDRIVDLIGIEVRNNLNERKFARISPDDRIVVVPQCVRHSKCPARLDSITGIDCKSCGLCIVKDIKAEAERLGYKFYIVPGGSFVKRIVKKVRPGAALGIACHQDLNMSMHEISRAECAVVGVPLLKDGCVNTEVDVKEVFRKLRLGIENIKDETNKLSCSGDKSEA